MEPRICKDRYNHTEKIKTLRILESNNFNYLQTSRQTKVSRPTLRKWEEKYGKEVFSVKSPIEQALVEIDAEMKHNDINIIRNLYRLRKGTLQKVILMADKETRLESLLNVLKFASAELEKFSELDKPETDSATNYVEYITKIMLENTIEQPSNDFTEQET
jgi:hypothetical protein